MPVSHPLVVHFLAKNLYGNRVELHDFSVTTVNEAHFQQIWQCVNMEVDRSCWTYLPYSGFKTEDELRIGLANCFGFKGSIHYLIEVNDRVVGWWG